MLQPQFVVMRTMPHLSGPMYMINVYVYGSLYQWKVLSNICWAKRGKGKIATGYIWQQFFPLFFKS